MTTAAAAGQQPVAAGRVVHLLVRQLAVMLLLVGMLLKMQVWRA
jgi:hypothetical protein